MPKKWETAEGYRRRVMALSELLEEDERNKIVIRCRLAWTLCRQKKFQAALLIIQHTLGRLRSHYPGDTSSIQELERWEKVTLSGISKQSDNQDDRQKSYRNTTHDVRSLYALQDCSSSQTSQSPNDPPFKFHHHLLILVSTPLFHILLEFPSSKISPKTVLYNIAIHLSHQMSQHRHPSL